MKKIVLCIGICTFSNLATKNFESHVQEYVILRNSNVLLKRTVDTINAELNFIQQHHRSIYDVLCAMIVIGNTIVYCGSNAHILEEHGLLDATTNRLKNDVDTILDARMLDQNSANPSPYSWNAMMHENHG